jgi:hypothetical protein
MEDTAKPMGPEKNQNAQLKERQDSSNGCWKLEEVLDFIKYNLELCQSKQSDNLDEPDETEHP